MKHPKIHKVSLTGEVTTGIKIMEAAAIEAGICWINSYNLTPVEVPFGGYKMSGIGRENSEWALLKHTQIKTIYIKG